MTIGIYTAMEKEAKSFFVGSDFVTQKIGAYTFYKFGLSGADAVLCVPPYVGEITAAAGTQMLIDRFAVDIVLNFGVVGALTEQASQMAMAYVGFVTHYQMDTSAVDDFDAGYYDVFATKTIPTNAQLIDLAKSVVDLPVVGCASGDKFVGDPAEKFDLADRFGAQICDMEAAGILITCKYANVPCLFVKCIADTLFGGKDEYWDKATAVTGKFRAVAEQICRVYNVV